MRRFIEQLPGVWRRIRGLEDAGEFNQQGESIRRSQGRTLVAQQRPRQATHLSAGGTLEDRYQLIESRAQVDDMFQRLQQKIFGRLREIEREQGRSAAAVFREVGRTAAERPYFFLKPFGEEGFLFERHDTGWTIVRADKIVGQNLFLRNYNALDQVTLFAARDRQFVPRVRSELLGGDLLPFAVYEDDMLHRLGIAAEPLPIRPER